jgi:hypothetical protein
MLTKGYKLEFAKRTAGKSCYCGCHCLPMAEVWAEMQTQAEETSRRLLPLEGSNHGSLGQDKHRPNYTYAGTYINTARLTGCGCRCKKGAACKTEA